MKLELVNKRTFDGKLQLLEYVPKVLVAPVKGREKLNAATV